MAQRRSKIRRSSSRQSRNVSGFLDDNTNIIDNSDPLWYDRTIVRPSTSFAMTRNATSILNPNSTVNTTELSDRWFNEISRSDSSKLIEEAVKKNINNRVANEHNSSSYEDASTESESDHESQRKRTKFRLNQMKNNKSDKSNAFLRALEKTTDSHTRNLTNMHLPEESESKSYTDDSKTTKKLRPKVLRKLKKSSKDNESNFDDIFQSDSALDRVQIPTNLNKSSTKRKNIEHEHDSTQTAQKLRKSNLGRVVTNDELVHGEPNKETANISINKSKNKIADELPKRILRSRSRSGSVTPSKFHTKSNNRSKQAFTDASLNISNSITEKVKKKKANLFSQERKKRLDNNPFDAVFETDNEYSDQNSENEQVMNEETTSKTNKSKRYQESNSSRDESEGSSIPKNIRRTKSRSTFGKLNDQSRAENVDNYENEFEGQKTMNSKNKESIRTSESNQSRKSTVNKSAANTAPDIDSGSLSEQNENRHEVSMGSDIYNTSTVVGSLHHEFSPTNKKSMQNRQKTNGQSNSKTNVSKTYEANNSGDDESENSSIPTNIRRTKSRSTFGKLSDQSRAENVDNNENEFEAQRIMSGKNKESKRISESNQSRKSTVNKSAVNTARDIDSDSLSEQYENRNEELMDSDIYDTSTVIGSVNNEPLVTNRKSVAEIITETPKLPHNEVSQTVNKSKSFAKSINKSNSDNSRNILSNKSASHINNQQDESDSENSSISEHTQRSESPISKTSKASEKNDVNNKTLGSANKRVNKSTTLNQSTNKNISILRDVENKQVTGFKEPKLVLQKLPNNVSLMKLTNNIQNSNQENDDLRTSKNQSVTNKINASLNKSKKSNVSNNVSQNSSENSMHLAVSTDKTNQLVNNPKSLNNEKDIAGEGDNIDESSVETSSDGTPETTQNQGNRNQEIVEESVNFTHTDDLLQTPHPAQSTLNLNGKPVTRITQFSFRNHSIDDNVSKSSHSVLAPVENDEPPKNKQNVVHQPIINEEEEDIDIEGTNSDESDYPLLTRQLNDIPYEAEKSSTFIEETTPFLNARANKSTNEEENISKIDESVWAKVKKKTDALKEVITERTKQIEKIQKERELKKARTEATLKQRMAHLEAEKKKKQRKPIDKAFYVNGQVYKQPKLPRPKSWVTDRLYKHLWKCMEPKFGLETRIKSEDFVKKLSDIYTVIIKRKKYENYENELNDLLVIMAKLNIIKDRYDFNRFCGDFMPYNFRAKVRPMQLPGNVKNIPYNPQLLHKPILEVRDSSPSNSDDDSDTN